MPGIRLLLELRFTRVVVSLAQAVHHEPFASLLICQHFSLLRFTMRAKAIFDDIQDNSVLDFPSTKPPLSSQGKQEHSKWFELLKTRASEICNVSAILEASGKVIFIDELESVPLILLSFLIFIVPLILQWVSRGVSWGSVDRGQCFVETQPIWRQLPPKAQSILGHVQVEN